MTQQPKLLLKPLRGSPTQIGWQTLISNGVIGIIEIFSICFHLNRSLPDFPACCKELQHPSSWFFSFYLHCFNLYRFIFLFSIHFLQKLLILFIYLLESDFVYFFLNPSLKFMKFLSILFYAFLIERLIIERKYFI